jgi:hypothetical protein
MVRLVTTSILAVACLSAPASAQSTPPPQPTIPFRPASVPWPLSISQARKAARAEAIRAWGARKPRVVSAHRVSYSKVRCRVTWRGKAGGMRTGTVKVKRTSADGVQAFAVGTGQSASS